MRALSVRRPAAVTTMPRRARPGIVVLTLLGALSALSALSALGACGDDGDRAGGRGAQQPRASDASRQGAQSGADAAASGASADSAACPKDGRWRTCSVVERLERAGLVPLARTDTLRVAFLTPPGAGWDVARVQLRVFLYDDPTLARREGLALDPFTVAPRGQRHPWPAKATLVRSANLVAVLLSDNDRQIERVQLALEAGPPQAEADSAR
jgi:hypothetical protein